MHACHTLVTTLQHHTIHPTSLARLNRALSSLALHSRPMPPLEIARRMQRRLHDALQITHVCNVHYKLHMCVMCITNYSCVYCALQITQMCNMHYTCVWHVQTCKTRLHVARPLVARVHGCERGVRCNRLAKLRQEPLRMRLRCVSRLWRGRSCCSSKIVIIIISSSSSSSSSSPPLLPHHAGPTQPQSPTA